MSDQQMPPQAVAIIGMAGRFPGAPDIAAFWRNLCAGVESVRDLDEAELAAAGVDREQAFAPGYVRRASVLDGIEDFDAGYFQINPRDVQLKDPQHRALLECAEAALQDAGYVPDRYDGLIGMFAGVGYSGYMHNHLALNEAVLRYAGMHQLYLHNEKDFAPTFVSYTLGLKGPSVNVNCGCSSSLVAVHMACRSLAQYESDIVLAGAASIIATQTAGYPFNEGGILAPDGRCRPFDADARGTLPASGVGLVVLKRYEDAVADRDHIYAVIRGSAINNDGHDKIGFTAPSVDGQARVIEDALAFSETAPDTVGYVEAHGTGTRLGDPIEIAALKRAYGQAGGADTCAVGSLKANIGHLNAASGVAGLIKASLALKYALHPPQIHFQRANPELPLAGTPFRFDTMLRPWATQHLPRRAAVSSFGIGGTNAHAVLEQAPEVGVEIPSSRRHHVLPLSALDATALRQSVERLAGHLQAHPEAALADVAHTLQVGRRQFAHRAAAVATDAGDAAQKLLASVPTDHAEGAPRIAWMFPGQGSQHTGMARELYEREPAFREPFDDCLRVLTPLLGVDLRTLIFADDESAQARLHRTDIAQPAIFAVSWALASLWRRWGLTPVCLLGHSIGEYVAACVAGVFDLDDALRIVVARGRAMQAAPEGAMLGVEMDAARLRALLPEGATIAAFNAPASLTVSGTHAAIETLERALGEQVPHRRLQTSHAFHSPLMDGVLETFRRSFDGVRLREPTIPFASNVTGDWIAPGQCTSPDYWVRHLREPVRFAQALDAVLGADVQALLEVGPGRTLSNLVQRGSARPGLRIVASLPHAMRGEDAEAALSAALARLWCAGAPVDWDAYRGEALRRRVSLPAYPFQRKRHWIERVDLRALLTGRVPAVAPTMDADAQAATGKPAHAATTPVVRSDSTESLVVSLCEERLGLSGLRGAENFFDIGGDSLIATQIVARLRAETGAQITLEAFLSADSLAGIARLADAASACVGGAIARQPATAVRTIPPLDAARKRDGVALSAAQQRMWFFDRFEGGHAANNIVTTVRLRGPLAIDALKSAFDGIVGRHESLRTRFFERDGRPWQAVRDRADCPLDVLDLSQRDGDAALAEARAAIAGFAARRIDLEQGPLMQAMVARLGADDHVVALAMHHIAGDSWSMGVVIGELQRGYAAALAGEADGIAPPPVQYPEFAEWQQSAQWRDRLQQQLQYWLTQLDGADPNACIAGIAARGEQRGFGGRAATIRLDADVAAAVAACARRWRVTQFVLLLSAYALLLSHEMGRDDVIVGTDVANRRLPELESMIGFFVNLLALRVRIDDGESIAAFVARVGALTLQSYENQDVPFDQVVAALNHPRDARFGPLFQHKLVFQNAPVPALDLAGVRVEPWSDERHAAELDMVVTAWNNADGFGLRIEYNSELFSERMCDDWLDKLRWLIGRIAASEDTVAALREGLRARDQERRRQAGQAAVRQLAGTRRRAVGLAETTDINGSES